jgi:hypothetical protein
MSEYVPFTDPRRVIQDGRIAKEQERERLGRIFVPEPEPSDADDVLDELVDAVAERIVERVQAAEPEQPRADASDRGGGFDGGARPGGLRRVETHAETLLRILRTRAADRGANF